jgi:hypothetical protein
MKSGITAGAIIGLVVLFAAGMEAQRNWVMKLKSSSWARATQTRYLVTRPRATVGGEANGIYCTSPVENGVGVHDLGGIPTGMRVVVTVESYSDGFDPVAAVVVPTIGSKASNNVRLTNFYDNDSGGDGDARIEFVTPQGGVYILLVNDFTDEEVGCYRYQVRIE